MSRTYKLEAGEYPSVTTVLGVLDKSSALMPWAVKMAVEYIKAEKENGEITDEILERAKKEWRNISIEAMDIGSEIHDLIEKYIKQGRDAVGDMRPEVENGFLAFLDWEQENIDTWIESERTVCHKDLCIAGTADAVAKLKDGRTVLIDFKSSKGFYDGYAEQVAIYRHCYEVEKNIELDGMMVLRLDKTTGMPEAKDYSKNYEEKLNSFIKLLDYWYAAKKRRCKNKRTA